MAKKPADHALSVKALSLVAQRFRTLADVKRLQILQELFDAELSVQELCKQTELSQPTVSKQLGVLRSEGLVKRRKADGFSFYSLDDTTLTELCRIVCGSLTQKFESALGEFPE
jgi:DNA-binding transcriptional ArsR family regulator